MTQHDPRVSLCQMRDHAREAMQLAQSNTREEFLADRTINLSLVRLLEIVGEDAGSILRTGTGAWKKTTFTLSNPRMVNRQNASADFRLRTVGAPLKVRRVVVSKAGARGHAEAKHAHSLPHLTAGTLRDNFSAYGSS